MEYRHEWVASFVAVADHGGFSAAATALGRSQPRVSTHVAELEKALDLRLFDRARHPVTLTPEGRALLPHARTALRQLASLGALAAEARLGLRGEVRIGVDRSTAPFLLPRLMVRLRGRCPGVRVTPLEASGPELLRALAAGGLDLAVCPSDATCPAGGERLEREELWPATTVAVLAEDSAPAAGPPAAAPESAGPFAPLPPTTLPGPLVVLGDRKEADRLAERVGLPPETARFPTAQVQTMVSLVRQGWGSGLTDALSLHTANLDGVRVVPVRAHAGTVALWRPAARTIGPSREAVRRCVRLAAAPATHQVRRVLSHQGPPAPSLAG